LILEFCNLLELQSNKFNMEETINNIFSYF